MHEYYDTKRKAAGSLFSYHLDNVYFYQELFKNAYVCAYTYAQTYVYSQIYVHTHTYSRTIALNKTFKVQAWQRKKKKDQDMFLGEF